MHRVANSRVLLHRTGNLMLEVTSSETPGKVAAIGRFAVAGVPVSLLNMKIACDEALRLCRAGSGGYCIFRDMNGIVGANDDPSLLSAHKKAAMVAPDGMPLVWLARAQGFSWVDRVYGPDFMLEFCQLSQQAGLRHYLYGSSSYVLDRLQNELLSVFPGLVICGSYSPPMRSTGEASHLDDVERIRAANPDIVWVGLGTPKQELWMQANAPHLGRAVLMGVGAAFDFHAKVKRQAPRVMQRMGLEWSFRLMTEPKRLGKRYLVGIPRFLWLLIRSLSKNENEAIRSFSGK
jgi:N-acetylglucosaminyldiphosphoundecaprenol N-acetyl-beta-D-mannosaminyltransferase